MFKKILVLSLLCTVSTYAQYAIKGTINPNNDYSWILLYKLENGKQSYIDNANVENGAFQFNVDDVEPSGIYRAYYQIENSLYVEFIYNKEEIEFSFNPDNPTETIQFSSSEENKIYQEYYKKITVQQRKLDSLQVDYIRSADPKTDQEIIAKYRESLTELQKVQVYYEKISDGKLANHFIKASSQYNSSTPHKKPQDYINEVKTHFFDAIDFKDKILSNSTFINDRLTDFVLYLNQADREVAQNALQKKAIENAVQRLANDFDLLKNFEESLLHHYVEEENTEMIYFVIEEFYNELPILYQDDALKYKVLAALKTAVGSEAPDFSWKDDGINKNLHSLIGSEYYIVVFFSSGCPHCQIEMPDLYDFINGIENIRVVTVGLEDQKEDWEEMTANYSEFINILDLDKWQSKKVKDYGVTGIPGYFVLDANKKILAKPNDLETLKTMFDVK